MKSILILLFLLSASNAFAQLFIDKNGMTIRNGTILSVDGLALTPDNDLTLSVNLLQKSDVPISIKSKETINKVYRFKYPVKFTGKALIGFKLTELNGNEKTTSRLLMLLLKARDLQLFPEVL